MSGIELLGKGLRGEDSGSVYSLAPRIALEVELGRVLFGIEARGVRHWFPEEFVDRTAGRSGLFIGSDAIVGVRFGRD
ncbi:MAG: hypothetical protein AAF735_04225 [Myxococcota bacterium]